MPKYPRFGLSCAASAPISAVITARGQCAQAFSASIGTSEPADLFGYLSAVRRIELSKGSANLGFLRRSPAASDSPKRRRWICGGNLCKPCWAILRGNFDSQVETASARPARGLLPVIARSICEKGLRQTVRHNIATAVGAGKAKLVSNAGLRNGD